MVISKKYKYVFIELPLTGSSAIQKELIETYEGELIMRKHDTYEKFLRYADQEEKKYFVFSCIRNPLDRTVSHYIKARDNHKGKYSKYSKRKFKNILTYYFGRRYDYIQKNDADFKDYFLKFFKLPYDDFSILSHKKMDSVIRFENLAHDFEKTLEMLDIKAVRKLPQVNITPGKKEFLDHYEKEIIEKAIWVFGPFMKLWDYKFPENWGEIKIPVSSVVLYYLMRIPRVIYWLYFKPRIYLEKA